MITRKLGIERFKLLAVEQKYKFRTKLIIRIKLKKDKELK
jgi:hypothetical protein